MKKECQRPFYRKLADGLTTTRLYGSYALAGYIVKKGPEFRSWTTAAIGFGLVATDKLDGWAAKKSNIKSVEGARRDEETDKVLYRNLMAAMTIATGDERYLAYGAINQIRDGRVKTARDELRARELPAGARPLGRYKTLVQSAGLVADLSPLGEALSGVVHSIHAGSVAMAAISGIDIVRNADAQIQEFDQAAELYQYQ